jgi:transposase-like protein
MRQIPPATVIVLTIEERRNLEELAGSRKSEGRIRERARIVLLAASGLGSRRIGGEVGCTPGTVSKWRVRYDSDRLSGLSETGNRGAERKYGPTRGQRILALLDQPPPADYSNGRRRCWRGSLRTSTSNKSGGSCVPRRSTCRGGNRGVKAPTPTLWPRRQTSLAYI